MKNQRRYGNAPFNVAVIHGGPGTPGEVAPIAKELSKTHGVLEPLQTKSTLKGQLRELKLILKENGSLPLTLIGHSWGAMLSFIFTAENPTLVKKLVLVSSGVFEDKYAKSITKTRLSRLLSEERTEFDSLSKTLDSPTNKDKDIAFARLGKLISKADSYNPLPHRIEVIEYQYGIFERVWKDAKKLRGSGELLRIGKKIKCPVVAIHGDYDPHPFEGIEKPLSQIIKDFQFILLKRCGHYPWIEREAKDKFYEILREELHQGDLASVF